MSWNAEIDSDDMDMEDVFMSPNDAIAQNPTLVDTKRPPTPYPSVRKFSVFVATIYFEIYVNFMNILR